MKLKKMLAVVTALTLVMTCFCTVPVSAKSKTKLKLVKSVSCYNIHDESNKVKLQKTVSYSYKNGHVAKISGKYVDNEDENFTEIWKHRIKKKKFVKSTAYDSDKRKIAQIIYNKKGLKTKEIRSGTYWYQMIGYDKTTFNFKYNGGMITRADVTDEYSNGEDNMTEKHTNRYYIKMKKGLPYSMTSNYQNGDIKEAYRIKFNKDGLAVSFDEKDASKWLPMWKLKYKKQKGLVKTAYLYNINASGKQELYEKYVFKYTKTKISKLRYAKMINMNMKSNEYYKYYNMPWKQE